MTFYDIIVTYIMPNMGDLALYDGYGAKVFYYIFMTAVSALMVHFFVVLPYHYLLRFMRYKGWFKC